LPTRLSRACSVSPSTYSIETKDQGAVLAEIVDADHVGMGHLARGLHLDAQPLHELLWIARP
jgi:hypothetical protein